MGQVPPKYFLPSAPYGASPAANALNPSQPAAQNPQTPLLPPNFSDPGTMQAGAPTAASGTGNPFNSAGPNNPYGQNPMNQNPFMRGLFGSQ